MAITHADDPPNKQILDEAAEWFVEFSTGEPDAASRNAFDAWLRKSPEHVRAYLGMFPLWEDATLIDAQRTSSAEQLIALSRAGDRNVVALQRQSGTSRDRETASSSARIPLVNATRSRMRLFASAATLILSISALAGWFYLEHDTYRTDIGEQKVVTLADGSTIDINARSKIRVRFDQTERRVELLAGQALFHVTKDSQRPFVVASGETRVRAVGTEFDVYRKKVATVVTVVEGRVAVDKSLPSNEVLLAAGEQLTITAQSMTAPAAADIASATAWRQRRLVFSSTPLPEVAEEFNRYNDRQLIVASPALDTFNISAVFSATDVPSLLRFLRAQPNITIEESDGEIRISGKSE